MRRYLAWLTVALLTAACSSVGAPPTGPLQAPAARLVLANAKADRTGTLLQPVDPDTLMDDTTLEPLDVAACSSGLVTDPTGQFAAVVTGAQSWSRGCADAPPATLDVLDLRAWKWQPPIPLNDRLDVSDRWPLAWSADGQAVFVITTAASEERMLWRVDPRNGTTRVKIDYLPQRMDVGPKGTSLFILGGQAAGNSRQQPAVPGSAFVSIYDPATLVERVRVPLSGLSLGAPEQATGTLSPGVAIAPDGSRYFVAHADRPLIDVVDTRAPKLERLERTISLRDTPPSTGTRAAWLGISPDGGKLFTWRRADAIADDLGLQMVDTKSWQVTTVDAIAQRIGWSVDGRFALELDPPAWLRAGAAQPQQRGPRDPAGMRLSVLDPSGRRELSVLPYNTAPFGLGIGQFGPERLYLSSFRDVAVYDTRTWTELARRQNDTRAWLVGTRAVW